LQDALRRHGIKARVHDAGVSGDTTAGGRARLGWTLQRLGAKPDLAIVELGANDMLRGVDPKVTEANLDAILAELDKQGIPVLVAGMLAAPNLGPTTAAATRRSSRRLARKYDAALPLHPAGRGRQPCAAAGRRRAPQLRRHQADGDRDPADGAAGAGQGEGARPRAKPPICASASSLSGSANCAPSLPAAVQRTMALARSRPGRISHTRAPTSCSVLVSAMKPSAEMLSTRASVPVVPISRT
jgi:hypothetical protein